jgi:aminoglycoside phosphotransferase (APT) family kinase protein
MPVQVEHGDYHERNVLLREGDGEVAAVIDWERIRVLPRAFQLVRAMDFMGLLGGGPVEEFLAAYGRHVRLDLEECEGAVEQWYQNVVHNTWMFRDVFIAGNPGAARFLGEHVPRLRRMADQQFRASLAAQVRRLCSD